MGAFDDPVLDRIHGLQAADDLAALRVELAHRFEPWLTPQDRAKRDLHVTVQNKVAPGRARALHADLSTGFAPWRVTAVGLGLWRYLGGPWKELTRFSFTEPEPEAEPGSGSGP